VKDLIVAVIRLRRLVPAVAILAAAILPITAAAQSPGSLAGIVTDDDGTALAAIDVAAIPADCDECEEAATATADDGSWGLAGLPPGTYDVEADDPDERFAPWRGSATVREGETTQVDITLTTGAIVTGTVQSAESLPLADVTVAFTAEDADGPDRERTTGEDGAYSVTGLATGTYAVVFDPPGDEHAPHRAELDVVAGETTTYDVQLRPGRVPLTRVEGADRVGTAVEASRHGFPEGAEVVFIAAGGSFPDALTAAPLAGSLDGPILLVGDRLGTAVAGEVGRLGASSAVIIGGVGAVNAVVQSELHHMGLDVRRIPGENRFDTTALIAREVGLPESGEVAVANGRGFADALSVAAMAAAEGLPVLLTERDTLPADSAEALTALGAQQSLILGGTAAVSADVAGRLPDPTRVSGANRYETSVAIAELHLSREGSAETIFTATGRDFPDAIVAGPVAGRDGGPLVLVDGRVPSGSPATYAFLRAHAERIEQLVTFGGPRAVSDEIADQLRRAGAGAE
jgi:putative cell wall-binding protein